MSRLGQSVQRVSGSRWWRRGALTAFFLLVTLGVRSPTAAAQTFDGRLLRVSVGLSREVSVEWRGLPGNAQDWVSVVHAGSPDDVYEATWSYTDGRAAGVYTAGRLDPGDYEARVYFDWPRGGYTVMDRLPFRVGAVAGPGIADSTYLSVALAANGDVIVSWRSTPGNAQDWVSVVRAGTADDVYESTWSYTGGAVTGSYNAGQLPPGTYEARLYLNWPAGGYTVFDRVTFRAGATPGPSVPPGPPVAPAGGVVESPMLRVTISLAREVSVEWRGTPGNAQDWVSVVRAGAPDDVYENTWSYTGGLRNGVYRAGPLPPGEYEARVYFDWPQGGYLVMDRVRFRVP